MYLRAGPEDDAVTRMAVALGALDDALKHRCQVTGRDVELIWVDGCRPGAPAGPPVALGAGCPGDWSRAPRVAQPEPAWAAFDRLGTIWVTDRVPEDPGQWAGHVASGGAAVPGVIGTTRASGGAPAALHWSGEPAEAPTAVEGGPSARVSIDPSLPAPLADFVALWAADRGVTVIDGAGGDAPVELTITQGPVGDSHSSDRVGRDGWSALVKTSTAEPTVPAEVEGVESDERGGAYRLVPWLFTEGGAAALSSGPGAIECGIVEFLTPPNDRAAFAVSIAALLDGAILPHPAVVSLSERRDAGGGGAALPEESLPLEDLDPRTLERLARLAAARAAAGLLLAAALAGALALWLRISRG